MVLLAPWFLNFLNCNGNPKSPPFQQSHDGLQVIAFFSCDSKLLTLDGRLQLARA
jgi:hypothetical protein